MKVLWLCNIMLPAIAKQLHMDYSVKEGWLTGTLSRLIESGDSGEMKLGICCPMSQERKNFHEKMDFDGFPVECFGFYENQATPEIYQPELEGRFREIVEEFKPDLVHVFGTEYPHTLAMAKVFEKKDRILIGIQGVITRCGEEYFANLPESVTNTKTFRDIVKKDSMAQQKEKFLLRGRNESEALKLVGHITGRTEFDKAYSKMIHEEAVYHSLNETMRPEFYTGEWALDSCKKHSIFFSQADYPLKGFHFLLEALPEIIKKYPDTEVVVAGNSLISDESLKDKIKRSAYGKYLLHLIKENRLEGKVCFTGALSSEEMKAQYLSCQTFVCASVLENSPNSVAEAMLLGVPVVAANVGGVPSMITHDVDGILFEKADSKGLADAIIRLWEDDDKMKCLSEAEKKRAHVTHDTTTNFNRLMEIYREILR